MLPTLRDAVNLAPAPADGIAADHHPAAGAPKAGKLLVFEEPIKYKRFDLVLPAIMKNYRDQHCRLLMSCLLQVHRPKRSKDLVSIYILYSANKILGVNR